MTNPLVQAIDKRLRELNESLAEAYSDEIAEHKTAIYELEQIKQLAIAEQERIVKELEAKRAGYMQPVYRYGSNFPHTWHVRDIIRTPPPSR